MRKQVASTSARVRDDARSGGAKPRSATNRATRR